MWWKVVHGELLRENTADEWVANQPPEPPTSTPARWGPLRPRADSVFARVLAVRRGLWDSTKVDRAGRTQGDEWDVQIPPKES